MNENRENDMLLGMGCSFVLLLVAALVIGVPLRDLALWAGVYVIIMVVVYQVRKRWKNRR